MRRAGLFVETNVYFYLHKELDRDVIEQVKILKEKRKLNPLIVRLLKEHFENERQELIADLDEKKNLLGLDFSSELLNKSVVSTLSRTSVYE